MIDRLYAGLRRFVKGFVAGGIASVLALTSAGVVVTDLNDLSTLGTALLGAFFTGGFLSIQKMLTWVE